MDGTFSGIGNRARPRVMGKATLAAMGLGILAVVVTGLILFFPKARSLECVAVRGAAAQPVGVPTTAPASMVLPAPAVTAVTAVTAVPPKPGSAVKVAKSPAKPKTTAQLKARSGKYDQMQSKTKASKAVTARKGQPKALASRKNPPRVRVSRQG